MDSPSTPPAIQDFRDGFFAMLPLWAGAIPSGIAFGVSAHAAGLGAAQAQLMSLLVFSSAAQISAIGERGLDQSIAILVVTVLALNAHLPLLGAAVNGQCAPSRRQRPLIAWFLTDGAFGVASSFGRLRLPVLLGAGVSMYLGWNLGTALGLAGGDLIPASARSGIDLVVPLTFLAVLAPMLRARSSLTAAAVAATVALTASRFLPAGLAILIAGIAAVVTADRITGDA